MSEVKVNKISPRTNCGTVQLGDSGDTITIPAGATITNNGTQTGFGRTGTVNWDTTAKTASFTAVSGNGYFVNTTSGAITVTMPASPSGGDIVAVKDYAQTFATNNCTIARNSSNIEGVADDVTLDGISESVTFVYVDSTKGWLLVNEATTAYGQQFVAATGGTITTCGNFKVHTFTGPGTFTVTCAGNAAGSSTVDYLVVAGGGGGAGDVGAGGGAGGFRLSNSVGCIPAPTMSPLANPTGLPVSVTGYPITVGAGAAISPALKGNNGSNSIFSTITSTGGGGGARRGSGCCAGTGGSGGGGAGESIDAPQAQKNGAAGNTPPVSPPQGNAGGDGDNQPVSPRGSGGGGGAGEAGTPATNSPVANAAGDGGDGSFVSPIMAGSNGTTGPVSDVRYFAGGGGGGTEGAPPVGGDGTLGRGGAGGGGQSPSPTSGSGPGFAGTTNTGGGGSGASRQACGGPMERLGGAGGSGIVIIRYKFQ